MKLFYGNFANGIMEIDPEEQNHIVRVLRMQSGDEVFVTDGKGTMAKGNLVLEGKSAKLQISELKEHIPPFSTYLHIAIAPTKNIDRIEFFVEKATEMGISEISFIHTEKTERKNLNTDKILKQAIAASKQSLRSHFPTINPPVKFAEFIKNIEPDSTFVAHCDASLERTAIAELNSTSKLTFLIGPEGDFSPREIAMLAERGVRAVSLGDQRLRTETAGIFVAAWNYFKMIK